LNQFAVPPQPFTLKLSLLEKFAIPFGHAVNKLPKKLTVVGKVQVTITVFFELFEWTVEDIAVLVFDEATAFD
jgi:hypothetical protein